MDHEKNNGKRENEFSLFVLYYLLNKHEECVIYLIKIYANFFADSSPAVTAIDVSPFQFPFLLVWLSSYSMLEFQF